MADVQVKGLKELAEFMNKLPVNIERNVMRSGLRAGAKVMYERARIHAPVGEPSAKGRKLYGGYAGALKDSLRIGTNVKFGKVIASIKAGGKNKKTGADVYYAHMVEWGTKAHAISGYKGGTLSFNGLVLKSVWHPGFKGKAFMRPAFDEGSTQAINETAKKIRLTLEKKHGLTTPAARVEGDE